MIINDKFITAGTQTSPIDSMINSIKRMNEEFIVSDFGFKIRDHNIFYILYMKDKLSYRRGFSIMIGDKTVINWDNCK